MLATPIQTITTEEEIETTHVLAEVNKQETLKKSQASPRALISMNS